MAKKSIFSGSSAVVRSFGLSMSLLAACSGNNSGGTGTDGGTGGDGGGTGGDGGANGPPITVTVTRSGSGTGTVTSQPAGIDCGGAGSCSAMFPSGNVLTLTAKGSGSSFSGWTGACAGQSAVCQITPSGDITTSASFDPLVCTADFICWEAPLPFGMDLTDISADATSDVWAVGSQGTVLHYDGSSWKLVASGTLQDLQGVSASSTTNIWVAGGELGLVLKSTGGTFSAVTTGSATRTTGVYANSPNLVFVSTNSTKILRYNGTWNIDDSNSRSVGKLNGISGTGTNVWVYGEDNTISHYSGSGATWNISLRDRTPLGIFATGASDGYIMNFDSQMYKNAGNDFNLVSGPAGASSLTGIWGTSATNIFTSGPSGVLYRYDGSQWTKIQTASQEAYIYVKGSGTAPNDVWAVGQRGVITHWDGSAATSRRANVFSGDIRSVWGSGTSDVWFSTKSGTVIHYNGTAYTESAALVTGAGANVYGLGGSGPNDVWLGASENGGAVLMHYNGTAWSRATLPKVYLDSGETGVTAIWAASATSAWALGASVPYPLHWDGSSWQIDFSAGVSGSPQSIWGSSASDVWMAGGPNSLYHYDGTSWDTTSRLAAQIYSLGGTSATDVWAGGDKVVYHWNGSTWSAAMSVTGAMGTIVGIAATASNDVWLTDSTGLVFRYNGTFKTINTTLGGLPGTGTLPWAANANNVWFGGRGILSYRR